MEFIKRKHFLLRILLLSAVMILGISTLLLFKLNKDFLMLWNANTLHIEAESGLELEKVELYYGSELFGNNQLEAAQLLAYIPQMEMIYKGEQVANLPSNYGENELILVYDNSYIVSFSHWKFNRRHQHDYHFRISQNPLGLLVDFEANGMNGSHYEKQMLPMKK